MSKGLALDGSNDIRLSGTSFTRASEGNYVAQKIRSKLQLIEGESVLDKTAGIPYFTSIFVKPVDLVAVASLFKTEILETEGVNELLSFDYSLSTSQRELSIGFSVNTIYGELDIDNLILNI